MSRGRPQELSGDGILKETCLTPGNGLNNVSVESAISNPSKITEAMKSAQALRENSLLHCGLVIALVAVVVHLGLSP